MTTDELPNHPLYPVWLVEKFCQSSTPKFCQNIYHLLYPHFLVIILRDNLYTGDMPHVAFQSLINVSGSFGYT